MIHLNAFERGILTGLEIPKFEARLGSPQLLYLPYPDQEWSWLPSADGAIVGVYLCNVSPVELRVALPNPTDGGKLSLPAGGRLCLFPVDNPNRVAISRLDGQTVGVPVFYSVLYRAEP